MCDQPRQTVGSEKLSAVRLKPFSKIVWSSVTHVKPQLNQGIPAQWDLTFGLRIPKYGSIAWSENHWGMARDGEAGV
jgi:hypothetical protein